MTSRQQFETKYPVPAGVAWNPETSRYVLIDLRQAAVSVYEAHVERWVVWQASRETLIVQMPAQLPPGDYRMTVPFYKAIDVVDALNNAGIKS